MAFRFSALPSGLRHSVFASARPGPTFASTRHVSFWARTPRFSSQFFTRTAAPSPLLRRKLLWLVPLAGGFALYAVPQRSHDPAIFVSPAFIPCPAVSPELIEPTILSPAEPADRSILSRIIAFTRDYIWEPLLTARRFIHLFYLFLPVILSVPMLLVGRPDPKLEGDRWGAVWWYGYLTSQMQRAGPTFIKVCIPHFSLSLVPYKPRRGSLVNVFLGRRREICIRKLKYRGHHISSASRLR